MLPTRLSSYYRNPSVLRRLALALGLLLALPALRAQDATPWPEVPEPPHAAVQWIADSLRIDNVPTRIQQFQSTASRTEVVAYYRAYWSGAYPQAPSVTPYQQAIVVSQRHGPYLMTVKVSDAPGGGSSGLISVSRILGTRAERKAGDFPLMPGAQLLSVTESDDPGQQARELVIVLPQSVPSARQFYESALRSAGWHALQANDVAGAAGSGGGTYLSFAQSGRLAQLSIMAAPGTAGSTLVANVVTKGTGPAVE